ncbi:bifunctional metallophosphatase/5'-nucleotidase [Paucibacter sediminis]|uniref:Bifunctional metallophosphatase/5'-nucleotidase n=1 Tax=Paucibacter sediminis TaxID=3019553 RepID=A0AA95NBX3_9BURK|nr:bifunctional metallophosphatase/5'-nucleotidase [Paucibacter sp. S2-9]WIT11275.1 bifunctional metallophosphatase/5'-nucleotidase [Paucibacter sp. S2-9]
MTPIARLPFAIACVALLLSACVSTPPSTPPSAPLSVKLLAINDFHGNLKPPAGGIRVADPAQPGASMELAAGGAEYLASAVQQLRAKNPNHIFVAAGDLVGASPLLSALFHDEPTIESLGLMGLEVTAVGNHEFDNGAAELLRKQHGGCHPVDGCKGPEPFRGARYQYLAASTWDLGSGKTLFPATYIKRFEGVPVGFIGLTLKGTPGIVSPKAAEGLRFDDEVQTINRLVPELQQQGVEAIVVLIHEGGFPSGDYNECPGISGPIVDIVQRLDKAVDLVVSGHTHKAYNCRIGGRLVTSGDKYGTIVSEIDLQIDRRTRDIVSAQASNVLVRNDRFAKAPEQSALIAAYEERSGPLAKRVVGRIPVSFTRDEGAHPAGETLMGELIADAQLEATAAPENGGAVLALTNIGGVRAGLVMKGQGEVSYEDVFSVQPFYNTLVTLDLSGAALYEALEQQWLNQPKFRPLQVSSGFRYRWDASRPPGQRVLAGSLSLYGKPIEPQARYRVTINSFMAAGGDGFPAFTQGLAARTGMMDVDALVQYLERHSPVQPSALDRVQRLN